jgi:hypothetical protein
MILKADGDGGVMLLKLAEAVRSRCRAADSMRAGGRRREVELAGSVTPLAAGRGAMPRGCDGGVDDAMPSRGDDGHDGPFLL